jgi:diaminohydroxyphosphoribosylaminopyrimidine deaminase/5-amino-6-(5-phosphoribosylamino)uracil reductase
VEGGGTVIESYLRQRLADKLYCFIAPKIVGGQQAKTPVEGRGVQSMAEAYRLAELNCENMAGDLLVTGYFRK